MCVVTQCSYGVLFVYAVGAVGAHTNWHEEEEEEEDRGRGASWVVVKPYVLVIMEAHIYRENQDMHVICMYVP